MEITNIQKQDFLKVMSNYYGVRQSNIILELDLKIKKSIPKNIRNIIAQSILKKL